MGRRSARALLCALRLCGASPETVGCKNGMKPRTSFRPLKLGRADIGLKRTITVAVKPDFCPVTPTLAPVIPAKAGIQTAASAAGMPANALSPHETRARRHWTEADDCRADHPRFLPPFPISKPAIPDFQARHSRFLTPPFPRKRESRGGLAGAEEITRARYVSAP